MAKKTVQSAKPRTISLPPATNPDGVRSVYCNIAELSSSQHDVRILFNEVISGSLGISVEQRAHVVMSIPHFIRLTQVMVDRAKQLQQSTLAAPAADTEQR